MAFSNELKHNIQSQYTDHIVDGFYKPTLSEANLYQRVSGFFSSAGIDLYADGIEEIAKNSGKIEFIVSKEISAVDFKKIKSGYKIFSELKPLRISERNEKLDTTAQKRLGNLAFMIAMGKARVKIALTKKGIFHDKFGIISSGDEQIFFNGSANETRNGISKNYESISVDVSWDKSENVHSRIKANADRFQRLWNNEEPNVNVIEASDLAYNAIAKYQNKISLPNIAHNDEEKQFLSDGIRFQMEDNTVVRVDSSLEQLTQKDRKLRIGSDIAKFFKNDNKHIVNNTSYKDIERIIAVTNERADRKGIKVVVTEAVQEFIAKNKYSIEQYKILGEMYKENLNEFPDSKLEDFNTFSKIVQKEVSRPLRNLHLRAAYYEYEMAKAANFSVPGAGKTAMLLGAFAFLNRKDAPENEKVDRMLVVCPVSALDSWIHEFKLVFGKKKEIKLINFQTSRDFDNQLLTDWSISNLILINYEALPTHIDSILKVLDRNTMLIFDEVHRIKKTEGKYAQAALKISTISQFRFVLTGTPIPNTYADIYNFLHILYGSEYSSFFGWNIRNLIKPSMREIEEINKKIYPFFWRTNKKDLGVPEADPDIIEKVSPSVIQSKIAEAIYYNETSSLAILIRLIQASTNPALLNTAIKFDDMMIYDDGGDVKGIDEKDFNELLGNNTNPKDKSVYKELNLEKIISPKFAQGIDLVLNLISQGKKVMVWGIFVNTLDKIAQSLRLNGVKVNLVDGDTKKQDRVGLIDEFRDGDVQVLVSNPQTLGESISLHQTVHDAIYFEYDFNLTHMLQSRDRIHRLGLHSNQYTRYYYLQTEGEDISSDRPGYIDEKIYSRLKDKEKVMYGAIDDNTLHVEYSESEIREAIDIIDKERKRIVNRYER
ncbi:phospholipase D-like domain-containing protein [Lactiplantibacillus plantarum]|uniref:SNF2-related protein n=1 Tax=Lactiplantibacillus plantarum TaxID=1590 RepID=UPI002237018A|nr:SNF2-related protein [Lactiplantibacillus plantarum]MCW6148190.1 phospholipase D-like domain-containing protein [Lactiplantibacillus plantarum]